MAELAVVRDNILEAGFTEGQIKALRIIFEEYTDMIEELQAQIEDLQSLVEVR